MFVDAGIAAVAVAGPAVPLDAQLERGEPGAIAEAGGGDLVGRDAGPEVGAGRLPRLAAGQERRRGAGVVAAAVAVGAGLVAGQVARARAGRPWTEPTARRIARSSKPAPSVAGVQSVMMAPLGT